MNEYKEYLNKIINYYNKHKVLVIFATFGILIVLNIIFSGDPAKKEGINTWNNITVGQKVSESNLKALNPILVEENENNVSYKYESGFTAFPNEVVISKNQTAQFIKEYLVSDKNHVLDYYIEQLGQYDFELGVPEIGHSVSAAVFLKDGLVIVFDSTAQIKTVVQKWYFEPTDKNTFLETWGSSLEIETDEDLPHPPIIDEEI